MDGYLDAIDDRQGCDIVLNGEKVYVKRARLGLHLQLARIAEKFDESVTAYSKSKIIENYLSRCKLDISEASAIEMVEAFIVLRHLNLWQMDVPWLRIIPDNVLATGQPPYHYDQRWWATWIHEIASRYGWERDTILDLWPEEAAIYLQEIQVSQYFETENQRALSEVSYEYNKTTHMSRFKPMPKPPWMIDESTGEPIKINTKLLPVGNVVPMQ